MHEKKMVGKLAQRYRDSILGSRVCLDRVNGVAHTSHGNRLPGILPEEKKQRPDRASATIQTVKIHVSG